MTARSLNSLLQPVGGLLESELLFRAGRDEPDFVTRVASLGNVGQVWNHVPRIAAGRRHPGPPVQGSGVGETDPEALVPAYAEALERYCSSVYTGDQFTWATARELGGDALDLDTVPRCSAVELSDPKCPLRLPSKDARIRWVKGLSLLDGRIVFLPAVMVYLYAGHASQQERFWFPITTGCAAHVSYEAALVAGLLEVVERDAISLVWLQSFKLPRIHIDQPPESLRRCLDRFHQSSSQVDYLFFDATTDLGIATVYALQRCHTRERLATLVSCSTALDPAEAVRKAMYDMVAARVAFRTHRPVPAQVQDFDSVFHGATYMADRQRASAFSFLLESSRRTLLSDMPSLALGTPAEALTATLARFKARNMAVYAVDLTTDEATRVGVRVVRVLVPALQPLSFSYRARFLAHPRLYQAPSTMGYAPHAEPELNTWPQPFS